MGFEYDRLISKSIRKFEESGAICVAVGAA